MSLTDSVIEADKSIRLGLIKEVKKVKKTEDSNSIKGVLGFVSAALFAYEVILTRYFSTVLVHNIVYVVVSVALFGIGMGGYTAYSKLLKKTEYQMIQLLRNDLMKLVMMVLTFFIVAIFIPFIPVVFIYIILAALPFIYGGRIFATIYMLQGNDSHKLYFADMLGAVLGCAGVIWIMNTAGFYSGIAWVLILIGISILALRLSIKDESISLLVPSVVFMVAIALTIPQISSWVDSQFWAYKLNPNKTISNLEGTYKSKVDILHTEWGAFSRTDVVSFADDEFRYILTDGGASAPMMKFDGDLEKLGHLQSDVSFIPHGMAKNDKTLLIGSGGGKDVLYALLGNSNDITAVEINESTVRAVNKYKDYNGGIYDKNKINLVVGDGRKFVDETTEQFDHIYLSMLMSNALDNSRMSLVENYIFTEEAFDSYYNALEDEGRISFMVHNANEALRVANTWIKTLVEKGVKLDETTDYFAIVNGMKNHGDQVNVHMPTVILKKQPFKEDELSYIETFLNKGNILGIHFPNHVNDYFKGIAEEGMTIEEMVQQASINLEPVTDNQPYFYKYKSFIPKELIPLGLALFVVALYFGLKLKREKIKNKHTLYFILIGMGYILIEVGLIQALQRYFEKPVYCFSAVLIGLLAGSGIGALFSKKVESKLGEKTYWIALSIFTASAIGVWKLNSFVSQTIHWELSTKMIIVIPILFTLGTVMGMLFPIGIRKLYDDKKLKKSIPIMYGINGVASVAGSIIAVLLAMNVGFTGVVFVGGLMYLILGVTMPVLKDY